MVPFSELFVLLATEDLLTLSEDQLSVPKSHKSCYLTDKLAFEESVRLPTSLWRLAA